ncbi:MAG TPA: type II toxin-antitoxin system CcdA family antitoxin [Azospirillaceae bacterium]|nr:type II toxin-antitoxin system CcdA family antitoxin [Azospirillaceae bacterium]
MGRPGHRPSGSASASLSPEIIRDAEAFGIDLSGLTPEAVEERVRTARRDRWRRENAGAFADYDAFVERHGVFGDGKRLF